MLRPACSLPAARLSSPGGLLTPRLGLKVSLHAWGLLPGAPTLTGMGLSPTKKAQRAVSVTVPSPAFTLAASRRTILSILRLSPQWEQERLPLYLLLLIRGQHGQAVTQRPASGLDGGTQGGTAAGRLDAARSREATRPLALF